MAADREWKRRRRRRYLTPCTAPSLFVTSRGIGLPRMLFVLCVGVIVLSSALLPHQAISLPAVAAAPSVLAAPGAADDRLPAQLRLRDDEGATDGAIAARRGLQDESRQVEQEPSQQHLEAQVAGLSARARSEPVADAPFWEAHDMHVVIMTYRRVKHVERLLQYLAQHAPQPRRVHVVITQSVTGAPENDETARAIAALVHRYAAAGLGSVSHVVTPTIRGDMSFSVNRFAHGSKRNSLMNLLHGLEYAFTGDTQIEARFPATAAAAVGAAPAVRDASTVSEAIVLEDDAELTADALAYFAFAAATMAHDKNVDFATAFTLFRPSLIIGNADVEALKAFRAGYPRDKGRMVDRLTANPRTVRIPCEMSCRGNLLQL